MHPEHREILSIRSSRADGKLATLARCRAGGKLRGMLRDAYPDATDQLDGHFLLLDDLAGASLVSSWGWFAWGLDPLTKLRAQPSVNLVSRRNSLSQTSIPVSRSDR